MVWRKRRRYRLANIVSYLCAFFGIVFIAGNVIMLRQGFVQLYSTAFLERPGLSYQEMEYSIDNSRLHKWRESQMLPIDQIPPVELPASAIRAELQLRKLMEDENNVLLKQNHLSLDRSQAQHQNKSVWNITKHSTGAPLDLGQSRDASVIHVTSRDLRRSLFVTSDCGGLSDRSSAVVGAGWTKIVYRATYREEDVALKMVDFTGHDMTSCLEQNRNRNWTYFHCYEQAAQKILKEIVLLRGLRHPHIVQVLAHCVPGSPYSGYHDNLVSMATELGESVDIIKLLHLSWEDRLRISYGLTKLLFYLAHSPYGSLVLNDFRRQQFVLVGGDLKLTDVDDVGLTEPACTRDGGCRQYHSSLNITLSTRCVQGRCEGLNEKTNIFNAARHFTAFLLPHGAPHSLRPSVDQLVGHYGNASRDARQLLQDMSVIVQQFSSGSYLDTGDRDQTRYDVVLDSELPGHDYSCRYAVGGAGCTLSVYDRREAEDLCDREKQCRAFVLTDRRTWTGRILTEFKTGVGPVTENARTSVFIKPQA